MGMRLEGRLPSHSKFAVIGIMPRRRIQSLDAKNIGTGRFTDQERDWLSQATTKELTSGSACA